LSGYEKGFLMKIVDASEKLSLTLQPKTFACRLRQTVLSILFCLYFFSSATVGACLIALIKLLLSRHDPRGKLAHRLTLLLSHHYIMLNPGWRLEIEDLAAVSNSQPFVLVSNHQSLIDVLVLSRLNFHYKWVAKVQIWRMLGVGQLMRINRYIPVAPGDLRSIRRMMRRCMKHLEEGTSIFIFPEGERTVDGSLLQFKDGPFRLACETDTPVLPIAIDGTRHILPRGAWLVDFNRTIKLRILPPVYPAEANYNPKEMSRLVSELIAAQLSSTSTHSARNRVA
jgi:1-acyl-sn-glycerol-3-phosphate acyltransferase